MPFFAGIRGSWEPAFLRERAVAGEPDRHMKERMAHTLAPAT